MPATPCPACGRADRLVDVGTVLDAGSAQPTGSALGGFYGSSAYEVDLVASRRLSVELERRRRTWTRSGPWRSRRRRRRQWREAQEHLRALPFCVRDEVVVTEHGQSSGVLNVMDHLVRVGTDLA